MLHYLWWARKTKWKDKLISFPSVVCLVNKLSENSKFWKHFPFYFLLLSRLSDFLSCSDPILYSRIGENKNWYGFLFSMDSENLSSRISKNKKELKNQLSRKLKIKRESENSKQKLVFKLILRTNLLCFCFYLLYVRKVVNKKGILEPQNKTRARFQAGPSFM